MTMRDDWAAMSELPIGIGALHFVEGKQAQLRPPGVPRARVWNIFWNT
jgi:hypothetical protein